MFLRRGLLSAQHAQVMAEWEHGGGFSVDAEVRIEAHERDGLEARWSGTSAGAVFLTEAPRLFGGSTLGIGMPRKYNGVVIYSSFNK